MLLILFKVIWIGSVKTSFLNVEEISSLQYGVEISKEPVLFQQTPGHNVMHISSKFGQKYSCQVPIIQLPKSKEGESPSSIDPKTVTRLLDESFGDNCLEFNKGWWTYKVCHKSNVTQYHISEKGETEGDISNLGIFEKEDDWTDKNLNDKKTKQLYHIVTYTNGSICDLTGKPRKTSVQYYCGEGIADMIIRVEEPATCEYIITVHSVKLCDHPAFYIEEKTKKVNLICYPALSERAYSKYVEKRKEKEEFEKQETIKHEQVISKNSDKKKLPDFGDFFGDVVSSLNLNDLVNNAFGVDVKSKKKLNNLPEESSVENEVKEEEFKEERTTKVTNKKVAEAFQKLNKASLYKTKAQLTAKFDNMREATLKEIKRSENLVSNLKTLKSLGKVGKANKDDQEFENSIKSLEESIKVNKKLIEKMDKRMMNIQKLESSIEDTEDKIRKEKSKQSVIEKSDISSTTKNLNKIKGLMSKFTDNPRSEHGTRFQRLSKIIENALDTKEDEDETETSIFEGLSNELDKQMKKLENLGKNHQRAKDADVTTSGSNVEDSSTVVEDSLKKDSKVIVRRLKDEDEEGSEKENEVDEEFKQKTKKMEEEVRKKLKAIGLDGSDKIKIKVITKRSDIDKHKNGENLLSSEQAEDIKDLFLNILGGGEEKKNEEKRQITLQESYNQIWDEYDEEEKEVDKW